MQTASYASKTARSSVRSADHKGWMLPKSPISQKGGRHMLKLDPTVSTLSAAGVLAIATSVMLNWAAASIGQQTISLASDAAHAADAPNAKTQWAASSTGRVEPKDGEIRITTQAPGKIIEVVADTNDRVAAGDLLVLLDDDDPQAKLTSAQAEALVREREREDEVVKGLPLERRTAEDTS